MKAFDFLKRKDKKKKQAKPKSHRIPRGLALAAALGLIPIGFLSLELAVAAGGFLALAVYVLEEKEQQVAWAKKVEKTLKALSNCNDENVAALARHQQDLDMMKEKITSMAVDLDEHGAEVIRKDPVEAMRLQKLAQRLSDMGRLEPPTYGEPDSAPEASNDETPQPEEAQQKMPEKQIGRGRRITKSTYKPPEKEVANDDYDSSLSDVVVKELLQSAMRSERVDIFLQPIVRLPQRQVRFYEIYGRIRAQAGLYVSASRYMTLAVQENINGDLDTFLLSSILNTIKRTAHVKKAAPFFINIAGSTLKNTKYMQSLLTFLAKNRHLGSRLVFELPHVAFENLSAKELKIIEGLGLLGCNFSLDHVKLQELDIQKLHQYKVRFVKIDAAIMLAESGNDKQFAAMWKFKRRLEANGIGVIAEKIEEDSTLVELLDFDLHYGQGYLFGRPDLEATYREKKRAA